MDKFFKDLVSNIDKNMLTKNNGGRMFITRADPSAEGKSSAAALTLAIVFLILIIASPIIIFGLMIYYLAKKH